MKTRIVHSILQLRKRLWAKPALYCFLAVVASLLAQAADYWSAGSLLPEITPDTIQTLLTIISSSMLAVATFAVGSMLASYSSASASATPRAFALVLADDVSQTALSSFIGAFIFSIVSIVALKTGLYGRGGLFVLFVLTLAIFAWVILTFVRWVDNIARLGRLGTTIDKAEAAARTTLRERRLMPFLGGVEKTGGTELRGARVFCDDIGYVQYVDMKALQAIAEDHELRIMVDAMPGSFLAPGRPVVILDTDADPDEKLARRIANAFVIGENRTFDEDPRFGLIVLSEIAARALSPAVNDPRYRHRDHPGASCGCSRRGPSRWTRRKGPRRSMIVSSSRRWNWPRCSTMPLPRSPAMAPARWRSASGSRRRSCRSRPWIPQVSPSKPAVTPRWHWIVPGAGCRCRMT